MLLHGSVAQRIYVGAVTDPGSLWANAAYFESNVDYLTRGELTGAVDNQQFTCSFWFNTSAIPVSPAQEYIVFSGVGASVRALGYIFANGIIGVTARNSSNVTVFDWFSDNNMFEPNSWHHVMVSYSSGTLHTYIDGVQHTGAQRIINAGNTIDWTGDASRVGSLVAGTESKTMSEIYLTNEYIDLSVEANRRKFITASYEPADLNTDGSGPTGTAPLIYLSNRYASFQTNNGTGGDFTEVGALTYARGPERVEAAYFDGTNDYLTRGPLTGIADGKTGSLSYWFNWDGDGSDPQVVMYIGNNDDVSGMYNYYSAASGNHIVTVVKNSASTILSDSRSSYNAFDANTWNHVLVSWDLAAGVHKTFVNDVDVTVNFTGPINDTIDYTKNLVTIGESTGIANLKTKGDLSELYFTTEYIDISVEANRRKFITAEGRPAALGFDGSLPTGTAPLVYLDNKFDAFEKNKGTGGDFTPVGGLTEGRTVLDANGGDFDGTNDYLYKLKGATATTQTATWSFWINSDTLGLTAPTFDYIHRIRDANGANYATNHTLLAGAGGAIYGITFGVYENNVNFGQTQTVGTPLTAGVWHHVMFSFDTTPGTPVKHLCIDGVEVSTSDTTTWVTNKSMNYGGIDHYIARDYDGSRRFGGSLSEFYFAPEYIDLSIEANRRKFIDAQKRPVFLGLNGELPTGNQPYIYFKNEFDSFGVNSGSGGDFTSTALTAPATYPGEDY